MIVILVIAALSLLLIIGGTFKLLTYEWPKYEERFLLGFLALMVAAQIVMFFVSLAKGWFK